MQPRRDLSDLHRKALGYMAERAGGADGKTAFVTVAEIGIALSRPAHDIQVSRKFLEGNGYVEPMRSQNGDRVVITGFRVLKLLPNMTVEARAPRNGADPMPPTPKIDEILAALEITAPAFAGAGASVRFLPIVEEAIALRRWLNGRNGSRPC